MEEILKKIKCKIFPTKYLVREIKQNLDNKQSQLFSIQQKIDENNQITLSEIHKNNEKLEELNIKLHNQSNITHEINHKLSLLDEIKNLVLENQRLQHELQDFKAFYLATQQQKIAYRGGY